MRLELTSLDHRLTNSQPWSLKQSQPQSRSMPLHEICRCLPPWRLSLTGRCFAGNSRSSYATDRLQKPRQPLCVAQTMRRNYLTVFRDLSEHSATGTDQVIISTHLVASHSTRLRVSFASSKWVSVREITTKCARKYFTHPPRTCQSCYPHLARLYLDLGTVSTLRRTSKDQRFSTTHHYGGVRILLLTDLKAAW